VLLRRLARPLFASWFVTEGLDVVRHPAAHAQNPGLVGCGQHDAATDGNRLAPERRVEQLLDRGIEGIEIRMQDGGFHPGCSFGRCSISRVCC
jgi:hypothetical protein